MCACNATIADGDPCRRSSLAVAVLTMTWSSSTSLRPIETSYEEVWGYEVWRYEVWRYEIWVYEVWGYEV